MTFSVKGFECSAICHSLNIRSFYSACIGFSYTFESGVYLLQGEIDCGAWAFVSAISEKGKANRIDAELVLNGENIDIVKLRNSTCYLGKDPPKTKLSFFKSIKKIAKKANYVNYEELFDLFEIPEHLINRQVYSLGQYYKCFLAMKGLIEKKIIFTDFWYGAFGTDDYVLSKISRALIKKGCIFIIPTSKNVCFDYNIYTKVEMSTLFDNILAKLKYNGAESIDHLYKKTAMPERQQCQKQCELCGAEIEQTDLYYIVNTDYAVCEDCFHFFKEQFEWITPAGF